MDEKQTRAQFYSFFMKGFHEDQIDEFLAKYNESPTRFINFLIEKQIEKGVKICNNEILIPENGQNSSLNDSMFTITSSSTPIKTLRKYKCNHCHIPQNLYLHWYSII